jgi:hypothetical protein
MCFTYFRYLPLCLGSCAEEDCSSARARWAKVKAGKNPTALLIAGARLGRLIGHTPQAEARRRESKRCHDLERQKWSLSDKPRWLTEDFYTKEIQPRLKGATLSQIALALSVSIPCASDIRKGRRRPHPRHWQVLARLAGLSVEGEMMPVNKVAPQVGK